MGKSNDDTSAMVSPTGVVAIPPTSFGKYTLVARTGRGGMADIYLAIAAGMSGFRKLVIIKRLREAYEDDKRLVEMFMDEARLGARLEHPNVVQTLEFDSHEGRHFLALEFLEGQTFARILRRKIRAGEDVPVDLVIQVASEVLEGLHYAHELADFDGSPLGVVHRDITPANIMLSYAGVVKILDFGVAKAATQMTETDPDVRKGKFAYLSPEQIEGRVDRRSDLFSLGIIMWEALAGRRLFFAADPAQTIKKALSAPIPRLSFVSARKLPKGLDDVIQKALKRNAAQRYQNAAEMRAALDEIAQREGLVLRRKDVAAVMADTFSDLREQHGRDLQAAVGAGLETATAMFEILGDLSPGSITAGDARDGNGAVRTAGTAAGKEGGTPDGTRPTISPETEPSVSIPGLDKFVGKRRQVMMAGGAALAVMFLALVMVVSGGGDGETESSNFGTAEAPSGGAGEGADEAREDGNANDGLEEFGFGDSIVVAVEPNLDDFEAFREEARALFAAGDYAEAASAYEAATQMNPVHAGTFAGLGAARLRIGETEAGLAAYQEAVRLAPTHSGFHAALGRAYRGAGRDGLALESYREAFRLDRGNRAARQAIRELEAN
ncbi:MAG: hypothetical protein DRJ42_23530 [Deltaproteobacteria bacterium]|nr:MAG: hypothetical protein DRJ42_23530 [Deltaproteobacteria bacterium]